MNGNLARKLIEDDNYSERTQISLSPTLREVIDDRRKRWGESLAAYLRKSAILRILAEEEDLDLKMLALENFVGSGSKEEHPEWSMPEKVVEWQRQLRRDAERID